MWLKSAMANILRETARAFALEIAEWMKREFSDIIVGCYCVGSSAASQGSPRDEEETKDIDILFVLNKKWERIDLARRKRFLDQLVYRLIDYGHDPHDTMMQWSYAFDVFITDPTKRLINFNPRRYEPSDEDDPFSEQSRSDFDNVCGTHDEMKDKSAFLEDITREVPALMGFPAKWLFRGITEEGQEPQTLYERTFRRRPGKTFDDEGWFNKDESDVAANYRSHEHILDMLKQMWHMGRALGYSDDKTRKIIRQCFRRLGWSEDYIDFPPV